MVLGTKKRLFRGAAGPAILLVLYVAFFWRLTLSRQFTWLEGSDSAYQMLPWIQAQARAVHEHEFPLWDPYEWGGQSFIGQMLPGTAYPLNWPLFALPLKNGFVRLVFLHWYFVLIHYLGGLFCYFLCRDRRMGLFASLVGGAAFGLTGWMGGIDWIQILNGAIWAPLIFLFLLRAVPPGGSIRYAGLAGTFLGISFLSGHHQIPFFLALAACATLVYLSTIHIKVGRWSEAAGKIGLFGLLTVLMSGFQTVPAFEYGRLAIRWVSANTALTWTSPVPYGVHEQFSLTPSALLDIVIPHPWSESRIFVGWALLALALLGLVTNWRNRAVRVFAFVGLGGLIFALGGHSIYQGLAYALLPLMEKARSPAMAAFLFDFAASVLAAFGVEQLWQARLSFGKLRMAYRLLYATAAASAFLAAAKIDPDAFSLAAFTALLSAMLFHALRLQRVRARTAAVLLALIALFELGNVTAVHFHYRDQPDSVLRKLYENGDVAAFLRSRRERPRVEIDRDVIPYNFGDWYGIDAFDAYTASMPLSVARASGVYWGRMLLSLRYSVGDKPAHDGEAEVFSSGGVKVYENSDAFPRAWSAHKISTIADDNEIAGKMRASKSGMRLEAFLTKAAPQVDACAGEDAVSLASRGMNRLTIDARMNCKGMVIASEVFAPGWRAYVDGKPEIVWPAYTFLRGVVVPAGNHRIEMIYRPAPVILGAMMTLLGAMMTLYLLVRKPRMSEPRTFPGSGM